MERRLDSSRKQGETIADLDNELNRLRKEEKRLLQEQQQAAVYTEQLETENAQLKVAKASSSGHDRRSERCSTSEIKSNYHSSESASYVAEVPTMLLEGNLEASYLVEQVNSPSVITSNSD